MPVVDDEVKTASGSGPPQYTSWVLKGRAFRSLAPEYLQRRRFECRLVRDAEYVVGCAHRV